MAMVGGHGAITHGADDDKGEEEEKDDEDNTEIQDAEDTEVQDDAATRDDDDAVARDDDDAATRDDDDAAVYGDGYAGDSWTASTLTPFHEPAQTTDPAGQAAAVRAVATAAGNAMSGRSQPQLGSPTSLQLTATTVQTADPATVIPVLKGQTTAVPSGSTITLGNGTVMYVGGGSVTVVGAGTRVANVPVTINVGSTVNALNRCYAGDTVIPADTRLTATSSPIALTQYRHAKVEVELINGSVTTSAGTQLGEVITHERESATATVGAAGASVTNTEGIVTITTGR